MSARLQVLLPENEMEEIRRLARFHKVSVGDWVRTALREAASQTPGKPVETRLKAIRKAVTYSFPTGDIDRMLSEIEHGYR